VWGKLVRTAFKSPTTASIDSGLEDMHG
jgi:hypothetical protein